MMRRTILDCMTLVGTTPSRFDGEKAYVSTGAVDCDHIDYTQTESVTYGNRPSRANLSVTEGDILFARMCGTKKTLRISKTMADHLYSTGFCAVRANEAVMIPELLYHLLASEQFLSQKDQNSSGATQKAITNAGLKKITVNVPSLDEQRKLAAKLDYIEDMTAKRHEQLVYLDQLVKSRFIELFGEIREVVPVSYYIKALTAGKSLAGEEECANKVLKTGAATYDEFDATQFKNLPMDYTPVPEHLLKDGDIIISRMNTAELVGATAYVWKAPQNTYLPDRLWRAELKPNANAIFVWQMLIQPSTKEQIRREASGTSGSMKNISKSGLLELQVKKVPFEMQNQFAAFVEQTDKSKYYSSLSFQSCQQAASNYRQEWMTCRTLNS